MCGYRPGSQEDLPRRTMRCSLEALDREMAEGGHERHDQRAGSWSALRTRFALAALGQRRERQVVAGTGVSRRQGDGPAAYRRRCVAGGPRERRRRRRLASGYEEQMCRSDRDGRAGALPHRSSPYGNRRGRLAHVPGGSRLEAQMPTRRVCRAMEALWEPAASRSCRSGF